MTLRTHSDQFRGSFESFYEPPTPQTVQGSIWGAAFRLENDVVNAVRIYKENRMSFPPEQDFELERFAQGSAAFEYAPDSFAFVRSQAEFRFKEQKVLEEMKDRELLAASGLRGIGAAMAAGIVSPTILLPFGAGVRAPTVGKAAIGAAGWGLVAAGLQEIPLQANQELRTPSESFIAVGSGAIVGGLLGAGVRKLDPLGWDRAVERMDAVAAQGYISDLQFTREARGKTTKEELPPELAEDAAEADATWEAMQKAFAETVNPDQSLSAARAPASLTSLFPDPGKPLNLENAFTQILQASYISPVVRQMTSDIPEIRSVMYQMGNAGLKTRGNLDGISTLYGGDVESRAQGWHAKLAVAIGRTDSEFKEWFRKKGGTRFGANFAVSDWEDFNTQVRDAALAKVYGRVVDDKNLDAAASQYLEYFSSMLREAKQLKMSGFTKLNDKDMLRITLQSVRKDYAIADDANFRQIVQFHIARQLDDVRIREDPEIKKWLDEVTEATGSTILAKADYAGAVAEKIIQKWTTNFSRHGTIDTMVGLKVPWQFTIIDPELRVPGGTAKFGDYLEKDLERLGRSFVRSMAGDIELQRVFGTVNPLQRETNVAFWSAIEARFKERMEKFAEEETAAIAKAGTGEAAMKEIRKIKAATAKKRKKTEKLIENFKRDFGIAVDRVRHMRGIPEDPAAIGFRLGRTVINLSTLRLMGMVMISSVADLARLVMKHGFVNAFKDGLIPMMKDWQNMKMSRMEAMYSGAALDVLMHSRSSEIFDLFDETNYGSFVERGIQTMTNKIGIIAAFDYWNQGLKKFTGTLLIADMSRAMQAVVDGKATKADKAFLGSLGLDEVMAERIWAVYQKGGATEVRKGVWLPNTEDWGKIDGHELYNLEKFRWLTASDVMPKGLKRAEQAKFKKDFERRFVEAHQELDLQKAFRAALYRGITNTIVQPGIERPNWIDASTAAKVIGQFRSFGMSSHFKTLLAAGQDFRLDAGGVNGMAKVGTGIGTSLALGALSYYLWGQAFDPTGSKDNPARERMLNEFQAAIKGDTEAMARIADEAIARSGLLGVFEEVRRVAERIPGLQDYATLGNTPTTRSPFVEPFTEVFGPTVSFSKEIDTLLREGPRSDAGLEAVQALMPYQNVFWFRSFLDSLIDQTKEVVVK